MRIVCERKWHAICIFTRCRGPHELGRYCKSLVAREACTDSCLLLVNHGVYTQQRRIRKLILGGAQVEGSRARGIAHGLIILATSGNLSVIQCDYKASRML